MKNAINKILLSTILALGMASSAQADMSVGFQSSGPSIKVSMSDDWKAQLVIGALGTVTAIEARALKNIGGNEALGYYGYGSVGIWSWDGGRYYSSETAFGAGAGVGLDYDIRNVLPDFPALFLSAEIGASFVTFDNYSAFDMMSVGFGIHYQF